MPASHGLILDAFCMSKKQTAIFLKGTVIWGFLSYAAKANSDMRFIHSVSKLYAELVLKNKTKQGFGDLVVPALSECPVQ